MQELFPTITDERLPDIWNPEESIEKIAKWYGQWKELTSEILHELWTANKWYSRPGFRSDLVKNLTGLNTWQDYCEQLPFSRVTAWKLVKQYEQTFLYNIWNLKSGDSDYFGAFPKVFMRNLLRYHTKEQDLIYDPFAGSGTTIDVCLEMNRRFYCSDLFPQREEIRQWNIINGLPDAIPPIDLAFLDPPYWKQAQGKYSDDESDLGNMNLESYYAAMYALLENLYGVPRIAILIQGTQYLNEKHEFENHMDEFTIFLHEHYKTEMLYIIPYSTQQYNAQQVEIMKAENKPMVLHRELKIFRKKNDPTEI